MQYEKIVENGTEYEIQKTVIVEGMPYRYICETIRRAPRGEDRFFCNGALIVRCIGTDAEGHRRYEALYARSAPYMPDEAIAENLGFRLPALTRFERPIQAPDGSRTGHGGVIFTENPAGLDYFIASDGRLYKATYPPCEGALFDLPDSLEDVTERYHVYSEPLYVSGIVPESPEQYAAGEGSLCDFKIDEEAKAAIDREEPTGYIYGVTAHPVPGIRAGARVPLDLRGDKPPIVPYSTILQRKGKKPRT